MLALALVFLITAAAGTLLTPVVIRAAAVWGIYDAPQDGRRVHTQPLPRIGGVAVFLSVLAGLGAMAIAVLSGVVEPVGSRNFLVGILLGGAVIFATGLIDDIRGLRPISKFSAQAVAALIAYAYGFPMDAVTFGSTEIKLGLLALPMSILWIVGVTNAFNLIDGLDGLAAGIALVSLVCGVAGCAHRLPPLQLQSGADLPR